MDGQAELQVADAVLEQLALFSTAGKTGSMNHTCWKTKNWYAPLWCDSLVHP
jgi:hypothetical protein